MYSEQNFSAYAVPNCCVQKRRKQRNSHRSYRKRNCHFWLDISKKKADISENMPISIFVLFLFVVNIQSPLLTSFSDQSCNVIHIIIILIIIFI